uniref:Uncharacterized protein n=1 Tax=Amphimedon queenslandica TaxID=400682 RepID=A0A1X7SMK4_AMPQE
MVYSPWYVEKTDLLGGYDSCKAHHNNRLVEILANESKYTAAEIGDKRYDQQNLP